MFKILHKIVVVETGMQKNRFISLRNEWIRKCNGLSQRTVISFYWKKPISSKDNVFCSVLLCEKKRIKRQDPEKYKGRLCINLKYIYNVNKVLCRAQNQAGYP